MSLAAAFRLDGRTALICGAARGLGWEIAQALAAAGAAVVLNGRTAERIEPRIAELRAAGHQASAAVFDFTDRVAMVASLEHLQAGGVVIDILVNAVGVRDRRPSAEISSEDFSQLIEIDLVAAYRLIRALAPGMCRRQWGRIVMLGSIVDQLAVPNAASYIAAKGGLSAMSRALAAEYGRHGVTCNVLSPGFFATETNRRLAESAAGRSMAARVPLQRWAEPAEIAGAALFLCSPAASYINGHTLVVDGGVSATYAMPMDRNL